MLTISTRTVSYTNGINIRCFFGMRNRFKWVNTNKWDEDKKEPQRTVASYVHFIHKYTHTLTPVFTYNYPLRIANMHTHTNTFTYSYGTAAHVCTCACVYTHASETELSIVSMEKWSEWELQRSHIECLLKYFRIRFVWIRAKSCSFLQEFIGEFTEKGGKGLRQSFQVSERRDLLLRFLRNSFRVKIRPMEKGRWNGRAPFFDIDLSILHENQSHDNCRETESSNTSQNLCFFNGLSSTRNNKTQILAPSACELVFKLWKLKFE